MSDYSINMATFQETAGRFLDECVVITTNDNDKVNTLIFYQAFKEFAKTPQDDLAVFGKAMKRLGITRNKRNYIGVRLLHPIPS